MKIIKYFFEFTLIVFLFLFFKIIGRKLSSDIGCKIAIALGFNFRSKNRTITNLKKAFPNLSKIEEEKYIQEMWCNLGRTFSEYVYLKNFRNDQNHIRLEGLKILEQIKLNKKPAVFISGHFANFELMAMELEKNKLNIAAVYRPLNNIFLNPLMEYWRKKYICNFQIPKKIPGKKGNGNRDLLKAIHNKNNIAVMVDQSITQGAKIKFFNELAFTTLIPSQLALKYNYQIIPVSIERQNNYFFKMKIFEPIIIDYINDNEISIAEKINQQIEQIILKNPGQWIWTHNRWKI